MQHKPNTHVLNSSGNILNVWQLEDGIFTPLAAWKLDGEGGGFQFRLDNSDQLSKTIKTFSKMQRYLSESIRNPCCLCTANIKSKMQ